MGTHVHADQVRSRRSVTYLGRRDGKIGIGTILLLVIVVAAIYLGAMLVPPFLDHYSLERKISSVAVTGVRETNDEVLLREIARECDLIGLDLPPGTIQITRDPAHGKWLRVTAHYVRVVEFKPFGTSMDLEFTTDITETFE